MTTRGVSECFFWYWLTWVVPAPGQNPESCKTVECVCVCVVLY